MKKRFLASVMLCVAVTVLLSFLPAASAGIKVINGDCPVYITSHSMGFQVIQNPNRMYTLNWLVNGFVVDKFPANINFKTITYFVSTLRYQPALSAFILTDGTGKVNLVRYEFNMAFARPGVSNMQIVDWKVTFPTEGYYALNVFVDGNLVGYFPFSVSGR